MPEQIDFDPQKDLKRLQAQVEAKTEERNE
jgi:hypothetical protein